MHNMRTWPGDMVWPGDLAFLIANIANSQYGNIECYTPTLPHPHNSIDP